MAARSETEASAAAEIGAAEAAFKAREDAIKSVFEHRRDRIDDFQNRTLIDLPERARKTKEAWMGELQMRDFRVKNERSAQMDAAAVQYSAALRTLSGEKEAIEELERTIRRGLSGFWPLVDVQTPAPGKWNVVEPNDGTPADTVRDVQEQILTVKARWRELRGEKLPQAFRFVPLPMALLVLGVAGFATHAWAVCGGVAVLFAALYFAAVYQARPWVNGIAVALARARQLADAGNDAIAAEYQKRQREIEAAHEQLFSGLASEWNSADDVEADFDRKMRERLAAHCPRALARNEAMAQKRLGALKAESDEQLGALRTEAAEALARLDAAHDAKMAQWEAAGQRGWNELQTGWNAEISPRVELLGQLDALARDGFPEWNKAAVESWSPVAKFPVSLPFGHLEADLSDLVPKDERLRLPCGPHLNAPLALAFPTEGSLLLETSESAGEAAAPLFNEIILRLLATTPPGKVSFTIFDPVGLGENFAGLMQLGDYEESLINRRIWTQRDQIETRLGELCEHLEKVIQMYLRNQYATIADYNEQAGTVAEKYHFVVVADFPAGFSETAAARLQSIATSGARCGVFTLLHWDKRVSMPEGAAAEELRANALTLRREGGRFVVASPVADEKSLVCLNAPPAPELAFALTQKIGKSSVDSNRVEVPFAQISPAPGALWMGDTTSELRIAIGRTGATKQQYLAIGKGTRQHGLIAGKTGSGKSTLFHVIITNLALSCAPDQVEFYLIDFKKGVEFKCYAEKRLPHARVIAIESDREFALSVLQRVDEELKRRGDLFRALGVQDVAGYKKAGGKEPIPRTLLIIDEFQEFFVEDDAIAQTASLLFDRIVRQGRAFGIHVLLGTQTLGGSYSLARTTLGQMVIRIALQCNEADAYLIMDESNPAPRLLSRPGEGIYNDASGALEGNSPFQVVWLPEEERDHALDEVRALATERLGEHYPAPIVFEGNAPAALEDNEALSAALAARASGECREEPPVARAWLGAPNSIKGPTEAAFQAQSGSNLLIVGQRDEVALNLLAVALVSLAAQYPAGAARFVFLHAATPGTAEGDVIETLETALQGVVEFVRVAEAGEAVNRVVEDLKARSGAEKGAPVFCFIHGLHKFRKLRHDDDFAFSMSDADAAPDPGVQLGEIITEGASHGIHLLVTFDTLNNVNRYLNRKALSEFEMRVVFQMSANDSASLVDSPKASTLGLHRALFYNEHEGTLETFRPYAAPGDDWFRRAGEALRGQ